MPRNVAKQEATVDCNAFVHKGDPEVDCGYQDPTRTKIRLVEINFQKYATLIY